ncbi:hypothetical protein LTR37_008521 [Vermiconidia calcicola]|uniref:Uncharacterized protein n=1 Tax=Vermiconidia calcicola TaxID=1690605 RepID=A0ACC3NBT2_9PEZI|nr:hypothetical protein LTR37_008521 [Vermiconidia calcicola]
MNNSLPSFSPSTQQRRPSYATVAAGINPNRFNTLAAFGAHQNSSTPSLPPLQPQVTRRRSRSSLRSMEIDGQGRDHNGGWKRPGTSWSNDVGRLDGRLSCPQHEDHPPFFTPSYLRQSRHVQRLHVAWDEHVAELQEILQLNPPRQPSLSRSSSNANLSKMQPQHIHRPGPVQDVVERMPYIRDEEKSHSLPSRWSDDDRMSGLEVLAEGTEVRFTGVTKTSDEAASVRSDQPMPKEVGLYYFEVTILSRGKDGLIGIGFSGRKVNLNRLPGWEAESWAYHGDDGYSFACTASGKAYGPRFSSQDTIGCGVNFRTGNAFFTKNGVYLGVAFSGIKAERLHPSVGMKKPNEHLRVNFGRSPFVFDIDRMMEQERHAIMSEIEKADLSQLHPPDDEKALIHNLIGQYLAHEGYVETAKSFAKDVHEQQQSLVHNPQPFQIPDSEDDIHAFNRQKIRKSILDGDIDRALKYTTTFYPHVLEEERNRDIHFRLKCRKFIEMMRRYTELSAATSASTAVARSSVDSLDGNGHAQKDLGDTANEQEEAGDTQMELDDQIHREASKGLEPPPTTDDVDMDASQELPLKASFMKQKELLEQALAYGQELQSAFGNDPRPQIKKQLSDIFAIMAYSNPSESVVGGLLDPRGRVQIAEEINGAILVSLGKPPSAAIEKLCAQTEALLDETAAKTGGAPAFINVRKDFLQP